MRINFLHLFLSIAILTTYGAKAQESNQQGDNLNDLSLEELMNITITSASKKAETVFDAPSIATTITAQEIALFGGNNLLDVLERSASVYNLSSMSFRQSTIGLRGDLGDEVNTRILFMIDGRPFRDSNKSGLNAALLTSFPLESIKQIEIIRGPGSVVHGTNAYIGVVNIITKKDTPYFSAGVKGGSFGTFNFDASGVKKIGEFKIASGINLRTTSGWSFQDSVFSNNIAPNQKIASVNLSEKAIGANLNLAYKNFSFKGFFGSNEMTNVVGWHDNDELPYTAQRLLMDIGWQDTLIADKYSVSINLTSNTLRDKLQMNNPIAPEEVNEIYSDDLLFEITNFYKPISNLELTAGFTLDLLNGSEKITTDGTIQYASVDSYSRIWYRGYFQADYNVKKWLKFVAGGQLNKVPNVDLNFAPRLGVIATASNGIGGKLLYGKAFRSPNAAENGLIGPVFIDPRPVFGDENLSPEIITTYEPQLFYSFSKGNISLNYFMSKQESLIRRNPFYVNSGELQSQGLELEWKYTPLDGLYINGSFSTQSTESDTGENDVYGLSRNMFKLGISYSIKSIVTIGIHNSYYSTPIENADIPNVELLSDYSWTTAKVNLDLGQLLSLNTSIKVYSEVINVLDVEAYNPSFLIGADRNVVQNLPGRAVYFGVKVAF